MNKKNDPVGKEELDRVQEPSTAFKSVRIFSSFEEAEKYEVKERASLSHDDRLKHVEELRKQVFHQHLLPEGIWPPLSKTFKIMKPYANDPGQQL